jgi:hypothetical protein
LGIAGYYCTQNRSEQVKTNYEINIPEMIISAREKAEDQTLSNVTQSDRCLANENRPSKIDYSPEDERKADTIEPFF